jgi:hypothetical protein
VVLEVDLSVHLLYVHGHLKGSQLVSFDVISHENKSPSK